MLRLVSQTKLSACLSCCVLAFLTVAWPAVLAQDILPQVTRISEADNDFRLDGDLSEEVWKDLPVIEGMKVIVPDTLAETPYDTHVRMFYTERGIFWSIPEALICQETPSTAIPICLPGPGISLS